MKRGDILPVRNMLQEMAHDGEAYKGPPREFVNVERDRVVTRGRRLFNFLGVYVDAEPSLGAEQALGLIYAARRSTLCRFQAE